jgi:hypothetical protein
MAPDDPPITIARFIRTSSRFTLQERLALDTETIKRKLRSTQRSVSTTTLISIRPGLPWRSPPTCRYRRWRRIHISADQHRLLLRRDHRRRLRTGPGPLGEEGRDHEDWRVVLLRGTSLLGNPRGSEDNRRRRGRDDGGIHVGDLGFAAELHGRMAGGQTSGRQHLEHWRIFDRGRAGNDRLCRSGLLPLDFNR